MLILDNAFVSDFLADFAEQSGRPVLDTPSTRSRLSGRRINWADKADSGPHYSTSENAIPLVAQGFFGEEIKRMVGLMKDKARFREAIAGCYPTFRCVRVPLDALNAWEPDFYPFVLKPAVGFLSEGVYNVRNPEELARVKRNILNNAQRSAFSKAVVDKTLFIAETFLDGPELAADAFYLDDGTPVITNIYLHPFNGADDVSDRCYITSRALLDRYLDPIRQAYATIGKTLGLSSIPVHAEFRDTASGIVPIEFNPLRFAGWCTTDLTWFAYHINQYQHYFDQRPPQFPQDDGCLHYFMLAERPEGVEGKQCDYAALRQAVPGLVEMRPIDYNHNPLAAINFGSVPGMAEIDTILKLDMTQFFH